MKKRAALSLASHPHPRDEHLKKDDRRVTAGGVEKGPGMEADDDS